MATISTPEYLLDQAKRRFTPSINNFPGMGAVERKLLRTEFPETALAAPPGCHVSRLTSTTGVGASGEIRRACPQMNSSSIRSPTVTIRRSGNLPMIC